MAACLRRRLSYEIVQKHNFLRLVYRTLLSDTDIKLEGYVRQRLFITDHLGHVNRVLLVSKLKEAKTPRDAKNVAFGIADLIHVAETEDELSELERLFRLISTDLESFGFGASLLRLYHHLGLCERAYRLYKDPVCGHLLSDNTCHKVLMDLLYKHEQYEQVLDVYSGLQSFNIDCVTLALGAHYHINTPESCEVAQKLVRDLLQQHSLSRRALLYAAMLCINQGQPQAAQKILKKCKDNILVFNLMMMCHAKLGQIQDILRHLEEAVKRAMDITKPLNMRIYIDTMMEVRLAVANCDNQSSVQKFNHLEQELSSMGVFSQQKVTVLLDKTIFGERSNVKQSGKKKVIPMEQ